VRCRSFVLLAALLPLAAHADEDKGPVNVKVGVYVLNVGKFDLLTGTYTIDFYLDLTSDSDMGDARFEFVNGRAATMDKLIDTPTERFFRIQANLQTNVDMHRFPWDEHELPIIIEPANRGKKELVYQVNERQSGIDPAVSFVGWNLKGGAAAVRDHAYAVYGEDFSQFVYSIKISRLMLMSSLKTFLPVICFLLISLISLLVAIEKLDARVSLNTAMLIAAVMFHMSVASQLPPAGYLTVADKVMVATYGTIAVNLLFTVQLMRMVQAQREQAARAFRELCFKLVPAIALLGYATAGLTSMF
jgi:hypothetical protein